jgi:predicted dehydrogenase
MKDIRFGIIGYGNIAHTHLKNFDDSKVSNGVVTAIFDIDEKKIALAKATYGDRIMLFTDENSFFDSHLFDAILICKIGRFPFRICHKRF